ncbi:unnamed protein product [Microthlaspi erraticum]|uniref:F-box domain-containing protein n=1 Tax=Microthlaspi erraticum TaxID=1685480 RepID=A0A6D2J0V0_9BRAS|nr:unnamed protein product [Microthlaspi erraticum]
MNSSKQLSPSLLPFELVEEILHRTPINSLVRFKSVSKQWYALFNHKRFIYKHLDLSKEGIIAFDQKSIQLLNLEAKALLSVPKPEALHSYNIVETNHCDGLLLCRCIERGSIGDTSTKLAVWNPVLSRVNWIEPSSSYEYSDVYGFGYDNVSRDNYKILRINVAVFQRESTDIEVYEFKSKFWTSVNATLECSPPWKHVSMNGNVYWIARKKMADNKVQTLIQSFDFSTETFKPICCVPNGICASSDEKLVLSSYGGDRLALLQQHKHLKFEVWVTSKVGDDDGVVSWSKYFDVSTTDPSLVSSSFHDHYPRTFILKTKKIMLWCEHVEDNVIYTNVYELSEEGEVKEHVHLKGRRGWFEYISCNVYVPSLVPVPE